MTARTTVMAKRSLGTYCHFLLSEAQEKHGKGKLTDGDKRKIEDAVLSTLDWLSGLDENNPAAEAEIEACEAWLVGIVNPIIREATRYDPVEPHPERSAAEWLDLPEPEWLDLPERLEAPTVATSPDERPLVQAAAASSRGDSCLSFAGISKWEICVQPEPPRMGETSVERAAFVAFTKEFLRSEFTDAELASMLELG